MSVLTLWYASQGQARTVAVLHTWWCADHFQSYGARRLGAIFPPQSHAAPVIEHSFLLCCLCCLLQAQLRLTYPESLQIWGQHASSYGAIMHSTVMAPPDMNVILLLLLLLVVLLLLLVDLLCAASSVAGVAESFTPEGLQTVAGGSVPANLVIYATGFDRRYDYLPPDVLKDLKQTEEGIPLYRDTLPTDVEVRMP